MAKINSINNKTGPLTITDSTDTTKAVVFDVSNVTTATTRTLTMDDRDINFDAVPTTVGTDGSDCTPAAGSFTIAGGSSAAGSVITITGTSPPVAADCSFLGYLGSFVTNATGDGSVFSLGSGTALTELYDTGGDFNVNGTFTAPSTNKYNLGICVSISLVTSSYDDMQLTIATSNRTYYFGNHDAGNVSTAGDTAFSTYRITADMDSSDTATFTISVSGSAKSVSIMGYSGGSNINTSAFGNILS